MENNNVLTNCVEMQDIRDELPWRDIFPELPTVEAVRHQEDPVFWAKMDDLDYDKLGNKNILLLLLPRRILHRCPPAGN